MRIKLTSPTKGSNPGGKCLLPYQGSRLRAYIKYCPGSKLNRDLPFIPVHQPIYEAITLRLAEIIGLTVPRTFILENNAHAEFDYEHQVPKITRLNEHLPFYFVSELTEAPRSKTERDQTLVTKLMGSERLYRDLLMIGDVETKQQNYGLVTAESGSHLVYVDLGCGFIDATNGELTQRNAIQTLTRDKANNPLKSLKTKLKHTRSFLSSHAIITAHKYEECQELISLIELVDGLPDLSLRLLKGNSKKLRDLISECELIEIQQLFQINMAKVCRSQLKSGPTDNIVHN